MNSIVKSEILKATPRRLQEVVQTFRDKLGQELIGIAMFGSTARGEAHSESDWDIFIVTRKLPSNPFERQIFLRSLLPKRVGTKVSLLAKTEQEFEHRLLPVYLDIAIDAVILFDPQGYLERKFEKLPIIKSREFFLAERLWK
ncbi:MAG: nucleotidyltransferase domain-containing protein, partial [Candidatus Latescibacteria bacterium]|nr:nucleotidyltransferase domain-containing protein [Candidatus Latescibacterota bacterium]